MLTAVWLCIQNRLICPCPFLADLEHAVGDPGHQPQTPLNLCFGNGAVGYRLSVGQRTKKFWLASSREAFKHARCN